MYLYMHTRFDDSPILHFLWKNLAKVLQLSFSVYPLVTLYLVGKPRIYSLLNTDEHLFVG